MGKEPNNLSIYNPDGENNKNTITKIFGQNDDALRGLIDILKDSRADLEGFGEISNGVRLLFYFILGLVAAAPKKI